MEECTTSYRTRHTPGRLAPVSRYRAPHRRPAAEDQPVRFRPGAGQPLATLPLSNGLWMLVPAGIMLATFLAGLLFTRVPNTHPDELRDALAHGEILLMADVPQTRVADIEDRAHHHHPGTTIGGIGQGTEALGLQGIIVGTNKNRPHPLSIQGMRRVITAWQSASG